MLLGALSGCGGGSGVPAACDERPEERHVAADQARADFASLRLSDLGEGWTPVRPDQPLDVLRPPLGGTVETARTSSPVFARGGAVARSSTTLFETSYGGPIPDVYGECLAARFRTEDVKTDRPLEDEPALVRVTLRIPRPTGSGADTVTVYAIAARRGLLVLEFVHGGGLGEPLQRRALARVAARLPA